MKLEKVSFLGTNKTHSLAGKFNDKNGYEVRIDVTGNNHKELCKRIVHLINNN